MARNAHQRIAASTWLERTTGASTRVGDIAERISTATLFGGGALVIVEDPGPLVRAKAERSERSYVLGFAALPRLERALAQLAVRRSG